MWRHDNKYCIYKNYKAGDMGDSTSILLDDGRYESKNEEMTEER